MIQSKRQQKFAGVIQKDLAEIFQREGSSLWPHLFITITKVQVSSDLSFARIYLSFFNTDNQMALNIVQTHSHNIRYKLGCRIKNQVKIVPKLEFFIDDTSDYVARIDKIFNEINHENSPEE